MPRPTTPRISIDEFMPATRSLNVWMPFFQPPNISERPRISSTLPITEPMIEARAMSARPALIASTRMTTSGRLPKLALRNAETRGPVLSPACSVATPSAHASPATANAATTKTICPATPTARMPSATAARVKISEKPMTWKRVTGTTPPRR